MLSLLHHISPFGGGRGEVIPLEIASEGSQLGMCAARAEYVRGRLSLWRREVYNQQVNLTLDWH